MGSGALQVGGVTTGHLGKRVSPGALSVSPAPRPPPQLCRAQLYTLLGARSPSTLKVNDYHIEGISYPWSFRWGVGVGEGRVFV